MSVAVRRRFVVLISGQGTNMQAIVNHCCSESLCADVVAVVSSRMNAPGIDWAVSQGIPTEIVVSADYSSRESFDEALAASIDKFAPDYVLLAGFMRVLTPGFVKHYQGRLINIHPSLLPAFPGLHTHQQALARGVRVHGCTVHFVTALLDHGPIIAQGVVAVADSDTPQSLAAKVLAVEHYVYGQVAEWLSKGLVSLTEDQRVNVSGVAQRIFFGGHHE
jgi:phosphoribosylglycinamide formyltransferase-1